MKRKFLFSFLIFNFSLFSQVFGENAFITSVLPNTNDDTTQEYIELTNFNSNPISLSGYSIKDKSGKIFTFNSSFSLTSNEARKFYRLETMILLNNTDEELWFYDEIGNQVDYFTYSTSTKDLPILTGHLGVIPDLTGDEIADSGTLDLSGIIPGIIPEIKFINTGSIFNISTTGATLDGVSFTGTDSVNVYRGTGELNFSGSFSSGSFDFINLNPDSSYLYSMELLDSTGGIASISTGTFLTLGLPIQANNLYYSDTDNNGKLDTLEIEFNKTITGSLNYDKFKIYSNTGGLASRLINSETGIVSSFFINDKTLKLSIFEQDNFKTILNISNTTTSDLRLKSLLGIGIKDLFGVEIPIFSLTSSFDNYKNVFKREIVLEENTGSTDSSGEILSDSGTTANNTETDNSGTTTEIITYQEISNGGGGLPDLEIPDIVYTFQQPSYILSKSGATDEYICDETKTECKVNLTLENSFTLGLQESDYRCEIYYGTGEIINSCNPDTYIFSYGTFNLSFKIIDKNNASNYKLKTIKLENIYETLIIPNPVITIQSGLDINYRCTKSDCSLNLTGDNSFIVLQNPKYSCLWDFGFGQYSPGTENNCNPGYVHYGYGDFTVKLRIFESGNELNYKESTLTFTNNPASNVGIEVNVPTINVAPVSVITLQGTISGKTKKLSGNILNCIGVLKCNVNFTGERSYDLNGDKLEYFWDFGNGTGSNLKNPKSIDYLSGSYIVKLKVVDVNGLSSSSEFFINFIPEEKDILKSKKISFSTIKPRIGKYDFNGSDMGEKEDFETVFKNILLQVTSEIAFDKIFDGLYEEVLEDEQKISKYSIKLQGTLGKNLWKKGEVINCRGRKNCKINLALDGEKVNGMKYIWDFGNGQTYEGINPKTVTYSFGKYLVNLRILDESDNVIFSTNLAINISPILKKIPAKSSKKIKKNPKISNLLVMSNLSANPDKPTYYNKIQTYELILIFSLVLIFISGLTFLINKNKSKLFET